ADREACSKRARELAEGKSATAIDVLLVLRALPIASNVALAVPNVEASPALKPSSDGVPELKPEQAIGGKVKPAAGGGYFFVAGGGEGGLLFPFDANNLSGEKGGGSRGRGAEGRLC